MKKHRFNVDFDSTSKNIKIVDKELINQIKNVLRLKIGEVVTLFDGFGSEVYAKIVKIENEFINFSIEEKKIIEIKKKVEVHLYCSVLKKENFELVTQKVTEVGVSELTPILSSRTVKMSLRFERLEKIIKEASEQSGRSDILKLYDLKSLKDAMLESSLKNDTSIFFDYSGSDSIKINISNRAKKIGLFVGPEGGWTSGELDLAQKFNFNVVSLGVTTLRAETAAIVGSFLAINSK